MWADSEDPAVEHDDLAGHYPRHKGKTYDSADQLKALGDGYYGLGGVFFLNLILYWTFRLLSPPESHPSPYLQSEWLYVVVTFFIIALATYPYNRKIAFGKGWDPASAIIASVFIGFNSAVCCGLFGYLVMQFIAVSEIQRYGLSAGLFSMKKDYLDAKVRRLRERECLREQEPDSPA